MKKTFKSVARLLVITFLAQCILGTISVPFTVLAADNTEGYYLVRSQDFSDGTQFPVDSQAIASTDYEMWASQITRQSGDNKYLEITNGGWTGALRMKNLAITNDVIIEQKVAIDGESGWGSNFCINGNQIIYQGSTTVLYTGENYTWVTTLGNNTWHTIREVIRKDNTGNFAKWDVYVDGILVVNNGNFPCANISTITEIAYQDWGADKLLIDDIKVWEKAPYNLVRSQDFSDGTQFPVDSQAIASTDYGMWASQITKQSGDNKYLEITNGSWTGALVMKNLAITNDVIIEQKVAIVAGSGWGSVFKINLTDNYNNNIFYQGPSTDLYVNKDGSWGANLGNNTWHTIREVIRKDSTGNFAKWDVYVDGNLVVNNENFPCANISAIKEIAYTTGTSDKLLIDDVKVWEKAPDVAVYGDLQYTTDANVSDTFTNLKGQTKAYVKVTLNKNVSGNKDVVVMVALYDNNKQLKSLTVQNKTLTQDSTTINDVGLANLTGDLAPQIGWYAKAFVWDNISTIKPISKTIGYITAQ